MRKELNNMYTRLTYEEYNRCKDIITINLHNDYSIIAIKSWNQDAHNYSVELKISKNSIGKWDLIEKAQTLEFNTNYKFINSAILKQVSVFLEEGFFDYYIQRYEYELECLDMGNEIREKERLSKNV